MLTVEIPIVCDTLAAGLGVRGTLTPWASTFAHTNVNANAIIDGVILFIINHVWLLGELIEYYNLLINVVTDIP